MKRVLSALDSLIGRDLREARRDERREYRRGDEQDRRQAHEPPRHLPLPGLAADDRAQVLVGRRDRLRGARLEELPAGGLGDCPQGGGIRGHRAAPSETEAPGLAAGEPAATAAAARAAIEDTI